jgi:hypothetical protein
MSEQTHQAGSDQAGSDQASPDAAVARPSRPGWQWGVAGIVLGAVIASTLILALAGPAPAGAQEAAAEAAAASAPPTDARPADETPAGTTTAGTASAFETPLDRQASTGEIDVRATAVPYRSDTFVIALPSGDEAGHELEQKLRAVAGSHVVYAWTVSGIANPEEFHADLHGHSPPAPGYHEASFRKGGGLADSGAFTVPFDGIHGWLFKNDSAGPATVTLTVAGFYTPLSAQELADIETAIEALAAG